MVHVQRLVGCVLHVVASADVRAFGDDVNELSGVGVDPTIICGEQHATLVELIGQGVTELITGTASTRLMGDHAVRGASVKGNRPAELSQQRLQVVGQPTGTNAAYFLTLGEDVVTGHLVVNHVHQERHASPIVSTQRGTVGVPLLVGLGHLVLAACAVNSVNVSHEQ